MTPREHLAVEARDRANRAKIAAVVRGDRVDAERQRQQQKDEEEVSRTIADLVAIREARERFRARVFHGDEMDAKWRKALGR